MAKGPSLRDRKKPRPNRVKKRTVPLGKNSCKRNYFLEGKQSKGNFDTPDLQRFSWLGKSYTYKKTTVILCSYVLSYVQFHRENRR